MVEKLSITTKIEPQKMAKRLSQFYGDEEAALEAVEALIAANPTIDKANAFRILTEGRGKPMTHASKYEGGDNEKPKSTGRNGRVLRSRPKPQNRWWK